MAELGVGPEALRLDGLVAVVTGASANIGAAIAASYLAAELAPLIRVNALCPGLVSETGGMRDEEPYERLLRSGAVPMNRIGRPEEIAGAAVYLASPAASHTTGEMLVCNGGRHW